MLLEQHVYTTIYRVCRLSTFKLFLAIRVAPPGLYYFKLLTLFDNARKFVNCISFI